MLCALVALSIAVPCRIRAAEAPPVARQDPAQQEFDRLTTLSRRPPAPPLQAAGPLGVTARDLSFESKILGRTMRYRVLLPASYGQSHRYYPVLYMLHGYMNASHEWDQQSSIARLLEQERLEVIVVLPQFDNSFYLNAAADPKDAYLRYFFRDLLPEVESRFRARTEPPARAVAGVSMGGYGALLFGLRFPQAFSFVAPFSGCFGLMREPDPLAQALKPFDLYRVIGADTSATRRDNDPFRLIESVDVTRLPPIWVTCGTQDFLFGDNLDWVRAAAARGAPVTFVTAPGPHEWAYWDAQLPAMLRAMARALGLEGAAGG